jgi:hypothetical protein
MCCGQVLTEVMLHETERRLGACKESMQRIPDGMQQIPDTLSAKDDVMQNIERVTKYADRNNINT